MPPPSHLAIATSSVKRLLKEEASYYKELAQQEAQIKALKEKIESGQGSEDDNGDFMLKQLVSAPLISLSLLLRFARLARQRPCAN
jgi:tubulin-specific chaperone A